MLTLVYIFLGSTVLAFLPISVLDICFRLNSNPGFLKISLMNIIFGVVAVILIALSVGAGTLVEPLYPSRSFEIGFILAELVSVVILFSLKGYLYGKFGVTFESPKTMQIISVAIVIIPTIVAAYLFASYKHGN